jgi:hypothetical protein
MARPGIRNGEDVSHALLLASGKDGFEDGQGPVPSPRVVPVMKKMVVVESAMDRCAVNAEHSEVVYYMLLGWERSDLIYCTSRQTRGFVIVPVNWCLRMNTRIPKRNPMQVCILQ